MPMLLEQDVSVAVLVSAAYGEGEVLFVVYRNLSTPRSSSS